MKMFLDEFKVLNMSELLTVNGGYGSKSAYGASSGSSSGGNSSSYSSSTYSAYGGSSSGYGTSAGSYSTVPVGYSTLTGWLPGYGASSSYNERASGLEEPDTVLPSQNTDMPALPVVPEKPVNPLGSTVTITGEYASKYDVDSDDDMDLHTGIDMVSKTREVSSVRSGTVLYAGKHPDGTETATGTLVIIKYDDDNYGLYGHMDPNDLDVKAGDSVASGSSLGTYYNGIMGKSSGGHLHYSELSGNVTATGDALARLFNRTGYFYNEKGNIALDDPTGQKLWNGLTVVQPVF